MRAVLWSRCGEPSDVVEVVELDAPPLPGPGEAQLAPEYSPINPADLLRLQGRYGNSPSVLPAIAGGEGVARVVAVGDGVGQVAPGDRVLIPLGQGCWRARLNVPAEGLFALPAATRGSSRCSRSTRRPHGSCCTTSWRCARATGSCRTPPRPPSAAS